METKIIYKNSLESFTKTSHKIYQTDKDNKEKVDIKDPYEEMKQKYQKIQ